MCRRLLKESFVILVGTLFFIALCATVGISMSTRKATPTVAAAEQEYDSEVQNIEQPPVWIRQYPHVGEE